MVLPIVVELTNPTNYLEVLICLRLLYLTYPPIQYHVLLSLLPKGLN